MAPSDLAPLTASRPLTINEISKRAENFAFSPAIPLHSWLRTAGALYQQVRTHVQYLMSNVQYHTSYIVYLILYTLYLLYPITNIRYRPLLIVSSSYVGENLP